MASSLRVRFSGQTVRPSDAGDLVRAYGAAADANRARFRARGDHAGRVLGPSAPRVLVTRTDVGARNARLTAPVRGTGRVNARRSDVASLRFGDGDRRGYVTTERRDTFDAEHDATTSETYRYTTRRLDIAHRADIMARGVI